MYGEWDWMWPFLIIIFIWSVLYYVQVYFGYGTAYRYTRVNGDNGVALFGWLLLFSLVAIIPGLGFYFWNKSKTMTLPSQQNSAGWYQDPQVQGVLRWWDGQQWTGQTATINR